jgi:type II secretory ATPase GspE/PulE/Tfp pilus assembly ATPase PilB-like protein
MDLNDEIRQMILTTHSTGMIREVARRAGLRSLREDGWRVLSEGATTVAEILRVTKDEAMNGSAPANGHPVME